jgi:5-methyltetrahydrofolate--homocysteine methyltransferase
MPVVVPLSGQTPEAFLISLSHAELLSIGFNCSMGASQLRPFIEEIASKAPFYISVYPMLAANQFGEYEQSPIEMAHDLEPLLIASKVNIIGGCCGTTPDHIRNLVEMVSRSQPHLPAPRPEALTLSGLTLWYSFGKQLHQYWRTNQCKRFQKICSPYSRR